MESEHHEYLAGKHLHFTGVLGSGMQKLATYAAECGASVSGSDVRCSPEMKNLQEKGDRKSVV